jgi:hypothetical protein
MEPRSIARTRIGIRRIAEPGLSNSYCTQASKAAVMSSAANADPPAAAVQPAEAHLILAE